MEADLESINTIIMLYAMKHYPDKKQSADLQHWQMTWDGQRGLGGTGSPS